MSPPIRVLELRSVRGTGGGPEKTILSAAALSDRSRFAVTVCYIRDQRDTIFALNERAAAMGVDYVEILERHSFDFSIWPALRRLVRERRIDIVHSHDYKTNFYTWLLSKRESVIPLATLHGYTGHSRREHVYYAADKRLVRRFPLLIAVSAELRNELVRTGSSPARVIRVLNGIDELAFKRDEQRRQAARAELGLSRDAFVIGTVGRLEPQKRFDVLMAAFRTLRRAPGGENMRLVIVGDGSLATTLAADIQRLSLDGDCVLVGHRGDVAFLHNAFDVFVQSSDYEGTPNAVLEAMALETPLVATDVGGTSELVTNEVHGLVVPPGQPDAIAAAVREIVAHPATARARTARARERVERELSFHARMTTIDGIYARLVNARDETTAQGALRGARVD